MTASKSEGELLSELHTQLEETQADDFETNRAPMLALVDQLRKLKLDENQRAGTTIQILENAFLKGVMPGTTLSLEEHAQRFDELENRVSGLSEAGVLWLFSRLEYLAANKIYSLYALAQTVNPAKIKEQCPWLPVSLVCDAEAALLDALKEEKRKGGRSKGLPGEKLAEFQQFYVEWLAKGGRRHETYGDFDNRMSEEFGRSAKVMANYRKNLESPDTRSEGDRD
ncbi:hypothetical protein BBI09_16635 [Stutzerimonas xanthomarina]|nr:hypothetical protein BBI09_16635 [Stutzerimonas xanthomarina]